MTQETGRKKVVRKVNKPKKRKLRPVIKLLCFGVIAFSCWLIFGVIEEIGTTVSLQRQLVETKVKLEEVKDENQYLIDQKTKLTDPNYVQSYARGNYMLTKDGEKIYYLPSKDK